MNKIEDLINCLATVLVSYHEYRANKVTDGTAQGARAHAVILMATPNYEASFNALNAAATEKEKRCEPLLKYILDYIVYFKHINAQKKVFSPEEFALYKKQIFDMLNFTLKLVEAKQDTSFFVDTPHKKADGTIDTVRRTLSGSQLHSKLSGWYLCASGKLISKELFNNLFHKDQVNPKAFAAFAATVLERHQYPMLTAQATELAQVKKESNGQKDDITALKTELEKAKKAEEILKAKLDAAAAKAEKVEAELSEQLKKASTVAASATSAASPHHSPAVVGSAQVFFGKTYAEAMNRLHKDKPVSMTTKRA